MHNEADPKKLLRKENRLWGGKIDDSSQKRSRIKSPISLSISDYDIDEKNIVQAEMANKYAVKSEVMPTNVLFPITNAVKNGADIRFITKMCFTLNISYPKSSEPDVLNTLKLWTLFGGVGARTRRGTGSIYCEALFQEFNAETDIVKFLRSISGDEENQLAYPRIGGMRLYTDTGGGKPDSAWRTFLERYGRYRQDRRPGKSRPGRSHWPEPDAIRRMTNTWSADHKPAHPDGDWFPRAAFGLPILVKFITRGDPGRGSEIHIEPDIDSGERYPSPVILKVIKLANGTILKCALVLNQNFPKRLKLIDNGRNIPLDDRMLPFHQDYQKNKTMRIGHPLNGDSIYENLANHLGLEEVK